MMTSRFGLQSLPAKGTELELHDVILYPKLSVSKLPVSNFLFIAQVMVSVSKVMSHHISGRGINEYCPRG